MTLLYRALKDQDLAAMELAEIRLLPIIVRGCGDVPGEGVVVTGEVPVPKLCEEKAEIIARVVAKIFAGISPESRNQCSPPAMLRPTFGALFYA